MSGGFHDYAPEQFELNSAPMHRFELQRRDFFKLLGGGIALFLAASESMSAQETAPARAFHNEELPTQVNAWLHINEQGLVTGLAGKVEIGQNIRTSLAQTIADELRVPFESVTMVLGDTALCPFDAGTFGSRTTPTLTPQFRRMAAGARELLINEAAKRWNTPATGLNAANGHVVDPAQNRSFTYAELARGKTLAQVLPTDVKVTPAEQWTIAGKAMPKVDARAFVTGAHQYTPDMTVRGALYGKVLRPPSFGATITSYDDSAAKALPNVAIVRDGDFVGAASTTASAADEALAAIRIQWKELPQISNHEIFKYLKQNASPKLEERGHLQKGSVEQGFSGADHRLDASYTVNYIAHAPLEPRAAMAVWENGKLTAWTGTQRPFAVRDELADAFHIPESDVRVIVPDTGSAYGGKHTGDAAVEAARIARAAGRPVKLMWTREEEFTWGYFRPAGLIEIKSAMTAEGKMTAWEFHNYHSGVSGIETPYDTPNVLTQYHAVPLVLRSGSYRGLGATANHFARETHIDSLAREAKMDPLEFRSKNLSEPRMIAVLQATAKSFGWPRKKTKEGQGFGIAVGNEKGSFVATCAEIVIDHSTGAVRVVKVVEAFECGAIVNPDGLKNQVVGAIIQGLGGALFEIIEFQNGRISNPHFATYRVPRFHDIPEIETILLDRKDIASAGAGETPIMAIAPAIGNAIFDVTGKRLTSLPLAPNGVKA